jgi:murein DD-endopeptidase MepM/ murein hydrolase activator NlpD
VVFAGSEYPGLVVIIEHPDGLYSMYGHLDYALAVAAGQAVERGQVLGSILTRGDGRAPSHLHFELRTFFTTPEVNGNAPRYGVACGVDCPPGPGYWPLDAPEHPSVIGWRNPTHVIGGHTELLNGSEAVVAMTATGEVDVWSAPQRDDGAELLRSLQMRPGDPYALLAIDVGPAASAGTSSEAYHLWYQLALSDGTAGWVQAARPSANDTGSDGRPSSVRFQFLPAIVVGS